MNKSLILISAVAGLVGCTFESGNFDSQHAAEQWSRYSNSSIQSIELQEHQALVVFYRTDENSDGAVDIFVNGDYQASLLKNSFSPVAVCTNKPFFSASPSSNVEFSNRTQGIHYQLAQKQTNYFKLSKSANGQFIFESVPAEQARLDLAQLNGEIHHTLSRVTYKNNCKIENQVISASALWALNQSSYQSILAGGKAELDALITYVKKHSDIKRIEINGFTDPEGSKKYNLALSQRRTDSVRQAFLRGGVTQPIKAVGYGDAQLIVTDCAIKHPTNLQDRAECNLPNRRVEVKIYSE